MKTFIGIALCLLLVITSVEIASAQSNNPLVMDSEESKSTTGLHGKKITAPARAKRLKNFRMNLGIEFRAMAAEGNFKITDRSIERDGRVLFEISEDDIIEMDLKSIDISFSMASKILMITFVSYSEPDESYKFDLSNEIFDMINKSFIG